MKIQIYKPASGKMDGKLCSTHRMPSTFVSIAVSVTRWIKDPTALKRHLKQTHGDLWDFVAPELEAKCAEVKHQLPRDGTCPWCERTWYSRHYHQCHVIFQSALLGLLHGRQRDGRLRELATGPSGSTRTTGDNGSEAAPREQLSGRTTKQEGQASGRGRGQGLPQEQIGTVVTMLASLCLQQEDALNRIRLETSHTLHLAQQGQGAALKALYNAGAAWQVKKNSGEPVQALRLVIFGLLLAETQARIQLFSKDDAAVKAAQTNQRSRQRQEVRLPEMGRTGQQTGNRPGQEGADAGGSDGHPDGATQAKQRPDHHQVQHESAPQENRTTTKRRYSLWKWQCAQPHSGPPRSDDRQRGMGSGSRAVETTQSQTLRASHCHSEGAGGRLDGPIQPGRSSPRSAPPLCPITVPPVASQRMRNLSNTCYINSLTFTILWQVQQRVDINVPEAWQRAQAQGTWTPASPC